MRLVSRGVVLFALFLFLVPAGFTKSWAKNDGDEKTDETTAAATNTKVDVVKATDNAPSAAPDTNDGDAAAVPGPAAAFPAAAIPPQKAGVSMQSDSMSNPKFTPLLATTGTIGLFTVETADTLPKGGFAFSAYGNKFGRMPGSVTIFQIGLDFSYGITDRLDIYGSFQPYGHSHIGNGSELSLAPPNNGRPLFPNTIFHTLPGGTPGYVEDFPFAANDSGGLGDITVGIKYGILSERHGAPVSLSIRNDLIFASYTPVGRLLGNGTLGSPFSDLISAALSKQWSNKITAAFDVGYMASRDPRQFNGTPHFT